MSQRQDAREALSALLGTASSVQRVYAYQAVQLLGESPVVCITSAGTSRQPTTMRDSVPTVALDIHVFVLYADDASGWTPQDAENTLDTCEEEIGLLIDANRRNAAWQRLAYADRSDARQPVTIDGVVYLHETIPVEALL